MGRNWPVSQSTCVRVEGLLSCVEVLRAAAVGSRRGEALRGPRTPEVRVKVPVSGGKAK